MADDRSLGGRKKHHRSRGRSSTSQARSKSGTASASRDTRKERRRERERSRDRRREEGNNAGGGGGGGSSSSGTFEWEIPESKIRLQKSIGVGVSGEVFKGTWRGTTVAVKKILDSRLDARAIDDFRKEIDVMVRLRHPNITLFMGACTTNPENLMLVTEFMPNGNLFQLLHNSKETVTSLMKIRMALDIARGMAYLHSSEPPIFHRDLKTLNLLLNENMTVKIADFGMTRVVKTGFAQTQCGTTQWMAPEVLRNEPYDAKADVFSFGIVLWEILTRRPPYFGVDPMEVAKKVLQGYRPEVPKGTNAQFAKIIADSWDDDPNVRPTFEEIIEVLEPMHDALVKAGRK